MKAKDSLYGDWFVLRTPSSHVSIPPNQKGTLTKDEKCRENVFECDNLVNYAAWWRACSVGTAAACLCMRPPRRDECSGAPHWSVGCDSLIGQGAFEYAGTMQDE